MNPEYEYSQCKARSENNKSFVNRNAHKSVCDYYWNKMMTCKAECYKDENATQESSFMKCLPTCNTDNELKECLNKYKTESSLQVCRLKCEYKANQILRDIGN